MTGCFIESISLLYFVKTAQLELAEI